MELKLIGGAVIIFSCTLFGFSLANEYLEKIKNWDAIKKTFKLLKGKIYYENLSIIRAMESINISNEKIRKFYELVIKEYKYNNNNLFDAWCNIVKGKLKSEIRLNETEEELLISFGANLGVTDRETQIKNFDEYITDIEDMIFELKKEKNNKCKMFKSLGIFSGIFITVLLM